VEALETILIKFWPVDGRWIEGDMCLQEELAEKRFVLR
jgi:hypothetical protein